MLPRDKWSYDDNVYSLHSATAWQSAIKCGWFAHAAITFWRVYNYEYLYDNKYICILTKEHVLPCQLLAQTKNCKYRPIGFCMCVID